MRNITIINPRLSTPRVGGAVALQARKILECGGLTPLGSHLHANPPASTFSLHSLVFRFLFSFSFSFLLLPFALHSRRFLDQIHNPFHR
ncbi:MAG: hypothetical protein ACRD5W_02425, partial [Candidatus Acidiferrales bacterium]